jgi:hypothetical protein
MYPDPKPAVTSTITEPGRIRRTMSAVTTGGVSKVEMRRAPMMTSDCARPSAVPGPVSGWNFGEVLADCSLPGARCQV